VPASCRFLEGQEVVESVYSGEVSPQDQQRNILLAVAAAKERGVYRFFTDLSAMRNGPSPGELIAAVERFESLGVPRTMREALVLPPGSATAADVRFYEDACQNRGWNMRLFPDRPAALAWLQER
jgi:hypothetical protein